MDIEKIKIEQIIIDDNQPRKDIINVGELANSINKEGLIYPIEVLKLDNNQYKIIDGERRFMAFKLLKKTEIPCIIKQKVKDIFIRQLITDFHKEHLNLVEQSESITKLRENGNDWNDIRFILGIGKTKCNLLRKILKFNPTTRKYIKEGVITANIINNISISDLDNGRETEIIDKIIEKKAKTKYQITKILLEKSDLRYILNRFITESYIFERKNTQFNDKLKENFKLIDENISKIIKNNSNSLENELLRTRNIIESLIKGLNERKKLLELK